MYFKIVILLLLKLVVCIKFLKYGKDGVLECPANKRIHWVKEGFAELDNNRFAQLGNRLLIHSVNWLDSGIYSCSSGITIEAVVYNHKPECNYVIYNTNQVNITCIVKYSRANRVYTECVKNHKKIPISSAEQNQSLYVQHVYELSGYSVNDYNLKDTFECTTIILVDGHILFTKWFSPVIEI